MGSDNETKKEKSKTESRVAVPAVVAAAARDINPNDVETVGRIINAAAEPKKDERIAKFLDFINENLTLIILAAIIIIGLIAYGFLYHTEPGKKIRNKFAKKPDTTETDKGPPETQQEPATMTPMEQQAKFTKDFNFHINSAIERLHKRNEITSKRTLCDYVISYTQDLMSYPATPEATKEAESYIMMIISKSFDGLPDIDPEEPPASTCTVTEVPASESQEPCDDNCSDEGSDEDSNAPHDEGSHEGSHAGSHEGSDAESEESNHICYNSDDDVQIIETDPPIELAPPEPQQPHRRKKKS